MSTASRAMEPHAFSPLRNRLFAALFIATSVSNLGTWMQDVGRAWLMTELTPSATLVALVQGAAMAAMVLLVLPAGVVADLYDRRRILLLSQLWMLVVSAILGITTILGIVTPSALLALTFALAAGASFSMPAFQAMIADIVGEDDLTQALVLNGVSVNLARAVGPAVGGLLVAALGSGAVFLLNAASFAGVIAVLIFYRREPNSSNWTAPDTAQLGRERAIDALRAGLRYAGNAPNFRSLLGRIAIFSLPAGALWSLLPLIARRDPNAGPETYGLLLAAIGAGSVLTGLGLPYLRKMLSDNQIVTFAGIVLGASLAITAFASFIAVPAMLLAGTGWMAAMALMMAGVQVAVPGWVRGRATALFLMIFAFGMTVGSVLWGMLADRFDVTVALALACAVLVLGSAYSAAWPMPKAKDPSATAVTAAWPAPKLKDDIAPSDGPIFVTVEYRVRPEKTEDFKRLMCRIARTRRASGTLSWNLFEHGNEPGHFVETNLVATWDDHLRQRKRQTKESINLEQDLRSTLQTDTEPQVTHWLGSDRQLRTAEKDSEQLITGQATIQALT
ncbi:MFS transporter [Aestuariibius sp. 2305UL40-4]|uniref:MFS transporter n=1 Tax=Aestuariibius violaceus TaxID=3234132 RepID=UPI00345EAD4A